MCLNISTKLTTSTYMDDKGSAIRCMHIESQLEEHRTCTYVLLEADKPQITVRVRRARLTSAPRMYVPRFKYVLDCL